MKNDNYLPEVKNQYENFPYPRRNPLDERHRLITTRLGRLPLINHFGFSGKLDYSDFRVLVAGGGTGDGTIYLAEQLREFNASVVHLDLSAASIEVAKSRAHQRGLTNIEWVNESLLNLPSLGLGTFDYINCSGVLHHLDSPVDGLFCLKSGLKDPGLISIMIYATLGRTIVYQIQDLMKLINVNEQDMQQCVENTKSVLNNLPPTNLYKQTEQFKTYEFQESDDGEKYDDVSHYDDVALYDMFLHSQDRSYTVPELYDWIESVGLNIVCFGGGTGPLYEPETYLRDERLLNIIQPMSKRKRQAISEMIVGDISGHLFYVSPSGPFIADLAELDNVPFFYNFPANPNNLANHLEAHKPEQVTIKSYSTLKPVLRSADWKFAPTYLRHIDGHKTVREILAITRNNTLGVKLSDAELEADFRAFFTAFNYWEWLLLRHKTSPALKSFQALQEQAIAPGNS